MFGKYLWSLICEYSDCTDPFDNRQRRSCQDHQYRRACQKATLIAGQLEHLRRDAPDAA
jgi:hypothetical protein